MPGRVAGSHTADSIIPQEVFPSDLDKKGDNLWRRQVSDLRYTYYSEVSAGFLVVGMALRCFGAMGRGEREKGAGLLIHAMRCRISQSWESELEEVFR